MESSIGRFSKYLVLIFGAVWLLDCFTKRVSGFCALPQQPLEGRNVNSFIIMASNNEVPDSRAPYFRIGFEHSASYTPKSACNLLVARLNLNSSLGSSELFAGIQLYDFTVPKETELCPFTTSLARYVYN